MTTLSKTFKVLFLLSFLIWLFPSEASAYMDPGSGSYIIQMIVAAAVGGAFAIKMFWLNVKLFFYNLFNKKKKEKEKEEDAA